MKISPGKHTKNYGKWPFTVDLPIKMVIFHGYVCLPEGSMNINRGDWIGYLIISQEVMISG